MLRIVIILKIHSILEILILTDHRAPRPLWIADQVRNDGNTLVLTVIPAYAGMTVGVARQTVILALRQYPQGAATTRQHQPTNSPSPLMGED